MEKNILMEKRQGSVRMFVLTLLRQSCLRSQGLYYGGVGKALWLLSRRPRLHRRLRRGESYAKADATGMILRRSKGAMAGQDGVLGFPLRSDGFGGQVAGFRKACPSSARDSIFAVPTAKRIGTKQVAPRLALGCFTLLLILTPLICFCQVFEEEEEDAEGNGTNQVQILPPILPITPETAQADIPVGLKYENIDSEEVIKQYSDWTGLALMKSPDVPSVKITLKCPKRLPKREALLAIEGVLAMNNIALVPMGDKFLKVVKIESARQHGMETGKGPLEKDIAATDHLVSRIVQLKHLEITEAQNAIQSLLHPYAKIIPLERVNCLLITETANNLKRILEIFEMIDQPIESREELRIFRIKYAKASEIQGKIEAIIADAQAKDAKSVLISRQLTAARLPFQPVRPGQPSQPGRTSASTEASGGALDRGLIQSKVKMVADDRINSLIVITHVEQFRFIENIIKALDQKIDPDVNIKVIILEYADAKEVVSILTSFLAASSSGGKAGPAQTFVPLMEQPKDQQNKDQQKDKKDSKSSEAGETQISGKLSADVKIISDSRINALLVMACKADMAIIEDVLSRIDIMLSQVLIEVVIIEVSLSERFKMGIDWLQRSMIAYNQKQGGGRNAFLGFSGVGRAGTDGAIKDGASINKISDDNTRPGSGLTYYFTLFDYNIDAVLNMLASTGDAKILATPVILTTDNTEAKIMVGEKRPVVTSTSISGGGVQQSAYQYVPIGIDLQVTPRINKKGFVIMDIKQKVDNKGEDVTIDGNPVPVITTRDFTASISVNDGRTIVIGGIVSSDKYKTRTKIPFLGDIPLLGLLFRSEDIEEKRVELMVMITPYVLDTPEKAYSETARRQASLSGISNLWTRGWSPSDLATPSPEEVRATKTEERKRDGSQMPNEVYRDDKKETAPVVPSLRPETNFHMRISNSPAADLE
ncbi:MAG: type II secretion system secretin GspD [Kiritimatiellia bacterium]|nr:type II secretion system secretin GspD [Kiritimatiellia bacterium]